MRFSGSAILLCIPAVALAQTPEIDRAVKDRLATLKFVYSLQDPETGGFKVTPDGQPGLRACNGAVKAIRNLGGTIPNEEKVKVFVLKCYDPATGAFAEPGGKPDVAIVSIGVMAACELGIPKEKFADAMDYLAKNAKTFEEMRIGAAAVEAWGVKDCPFDLKPWLKTAREVLSRNVTSARDQGSAIAFWLRLGEPMTQADKRKVFPLLHVSQRDDGGWGKTDVKTSDIETTYRVMRAYHLLKMTPPDQETLRGFIARHRNADGGYATKPGGPSSMSGVYYCSIISKWLDKMEGKSN